MMPSAVVYCTFVLHSFPLAQTSRIVWRVRHNVPVMVGTRLCIERTEEVWCDVDHDGCHRSECKDGELV